MYVAWACENGRERRKREVSDSDALESKEKAKFNLLDGLSRLDESSVLERGESILEQVSFGLKRRENVSRRSVELATKNETKRKRKTNLETSETVAQLLSQLHVNLSSSSDHVLPDLDSSKTSSQLLILRLSSSGDDLRTKRRGLVDGFADGRKGAEGLGEVFRLDEEISFGGLMSEQNQEEESDDEEREAKAKRGERETHVGSDLISLPPLLLRLPLGPPLLLPTRILLLSSLRYLRLLLVVPILGHIHLHPEHELLARSIRLSNILPSLQHPLLDSPVLGLLVQPSHLGLVSLPEKLLVSSLGRVVALSRRRQGNGWDVGSRLKLTLLEGFGSLDLLLMSELSRSIPLSYGSVELEETSSLDPSVVFLTSLDSVEQS